MTPAEARAHLAARYDRLATAPSNRRHWRIRDNEALGVLLANPAGIDPQVRRAQEILAAAHEYSGSANSVSAILDKLGPLIAAPITSQTELLCALSRIEGLAYDRGNFTAETLALIRRIARRALGLEKEPA